VVVGDLLRIVGSSTQISITAVGDTELELESGLSSDVESNGFEIRSQAALQYETMQELLQTYTTSATLLPKNNFDENLDEIDNAVTLALLPGRNFASSRNRAKQLLAELLSIMTDSPRRSDEYSTTPLTASLNLEDILADFSVTAVEAFDNLLNTFIERKYTRAVSLLQSAQIAGFYSSDEETGSFGGAVMSSSRAVSRDLPDVPSGDFEVDDTVNLAVGSTEHLDADFYFDDTEDDFDLTD
jgi:hypothetical protein